MELMIISIPLSSSIALITLGRYIGHKGGKIIGITSILSSVIISIITGIGYIEGQIKIIKIKEWYEIGILKGVLELIYDKESIIMANLISIITVIVIVYSYWYLEEEAHLNRFISYLLLFSVSMYILVSSKNILFSFLGWEGVGVLSYLLINYWANSISNNKSAIKAIIFNKVGDIFYLMGLILLGSVSNSFDYSLINLTILPSEIGQLVAVCFILAAMAKSAQIFLHCWLGDAMAGPTPVSALLHAATMVTAGIFLLIRTGDILYNGNIGELIKIIGMLTILFAGISSYCQNDIKKVIAYSTCAQIGYMFFVISINKYPIGLDISIYHLVTHGFFKALLFLSAGLIIHSFILEQDLRKYGSYILISPLFYIFFLVGSLALVGLPSFSGFYSKDLILLHSLESPISCYILLLLGSLISTLYSLKIIQLTFFNKPLLFLPFHSLNRYTFLIPFSALLIGSISLGYFSNSFFSSPWDINLDLEIFLNTSPFFKFFPLFLPLIGILFYILVLNYSMVLSSKIRHILFSISNRKFLFDPFYNFFFTRPFFSLSYHFAYKFLDRGLLEFFGPMSLFRLFFFFPLNFQLNNQLSSNHPYLYYYLFLSFLLFPSFFYFLP